MRGGRSVLGVGCWVLGVRFVLVLVLVLVLGLCRKGFASPEPGGAGKGPAAPTTPNTEHPTPNTDIAKTIAPNGLRLLCKPNPASDIVAIDCLVRVGLRDEPEEIAGIAALLGEAIIRGTERHPPARMPEAVAAVGGALELTPGFDFTELTLSTTRERFPQALQLLAEVLGQATFEPAALDGARSALKRRIAALNDDLTASAYQELLLQLYPTTPYGRPIPGYAASLDRIDRKQLESFYHDHYVQNRMVVAVVGNIDPQAAAEQTRKAFDGIPFRREEAAEPLTPSGHPVITPSVPARPRVSMRRRPARLAQVMIGAMAPPTDADTQAVWMVLDAVIGGGKRARLFANIREKFGIGYVLGSFYQPLLDRSHLVAYIGTAPYRPNPQTQLPELALDVVRARLLEQFQSLAASGPTDSELQRAKNYVTGSFARQHERNREQAHWLVWMEAVGLGFRFDRDLPAKIATVTKEQIQQASKDCLDNYALVVTVPTME